MVKFLLFKSRKILKEGMNMERTKGDLSFNPSYLALMVWGENAHEYWDMCRENLIVQNILLACYNDRCTVEDISLQIGVAVPYLERDLKKLCEKDLLIQKGGKYETNIIIFTKEFSEEADGKTLPLKREMAEIINKCLKERIEDIKSIGFNRGTPDDTFLKWLITHIIFREADSKYGKTYGIEFTKNYGGTETFVCGEEMFPKHPGFILQSGRRNANGDEIFFMDFSICGPREPDLFYFDRYPNRVNVILEIAKENTTEFSENDLSEIAEFIKRGFVVKNGDELILKLPIFTKEQYEKLKILIDDVTNIIAVKMREIGNITTDILVQHTPIPLKKEAENIGAWTRKADCTTSLVKIMVDTGYLQQVADNAHPTTFIMLA